MIRVSGVDVLMLQYLRALLASSLENQDECLKSLHTDS